MDLRRQTQWILGIRPTQKGFLIAPVIRDKWKGFQGTGVFRGVRYLIQVKRKVQGNAVALTVVGQEVESTVVPLPRSGTGEVRVEVQLGS